MNSYITFLSRNKLYALIEAFGMAFALGFIILLVAYAKTEYSVGRNIKDADKIYIMGSGDSFGMTLDTPVEFCPQIPEVERWTRFSYGSARDVMVGDAYYKIESLFIDSTFFQMFDYELSGCDRARVLTSEDEVIVSESFARKAFGGEEAVGRHLKIKDKDYTVTGVAEDFGRKDLFSPIDIFFSIKLAYNYYQRMDNFGNTQTFMTLKPGADADSVAAKLLKKYVEYWPSFYSEDNSDNALMWGSTLTRFDQAYMSPIESFQVIKKGNKTLIEILLLVAIVLLVSACFNYVNLTVALTGKRAKEMTMRRVMGEQRWGIIVRYFAESLLFTTACFLMGCIVALLFQPLFEEWLETTIPLMPDITTLLVGVAVLVLLSLISSLLPAMLVLQFKPIDVVKGTFQMKNKMVFSKVFIVVQNVISMTLTAVAITMAMQMHHLVTLPMGYETRDLILVETFECGIYDHDRGEILRNSLLALPQVEAVGMAGALPFHMSCNGLVDAEGNKTWMYYSSMDTTAFRLLGFKVEETFSEPTDSMCWIDREAAQRYGVTRQHPSVDGKSEGSTGIVSMQPRYNVCGIVGNYRHGTAIDTPRFDDGHNVIQMLGNKGYSWNLIVKVRGDRHEALAAVKKACNATVKELTGLPKEAECKYLDAEMDDALQKERHTMQLVLCFMLMSMLISALGLFAMSLNYSEQHSKEIAMRKILGATVVSSASKLSWPFILLAIIAMALSVPLCIKIMTYYLQGFYNRIDFPWVAIILAAIITVIVVILSVVGQTMRIAMRNPIEGVKTE